MKYDPQQTYGEQEYNPPSYPCNYYDYYTYKLGRCNVTGLWSEYDPDIEWACEHLNLAYKWRYKNVFCYICNPSLVSTSSELLYDRCNVTGKGQGENVGGFFFVVIFRIYQIICFCFVVAMSDPVHNLETMHDLR